MTHAEQRARRVEVVQAVKNGECCIDIAMRLGLAVSSVREYYKQDPDVVETKIVEKKKRDETILGMMIGGATVAETIHKFRVSKSTLSNVLHDAGTSLRELQVARTVRRDDTIASEIMRGSSLESVMENYSVSANRVFVACCAAKVSCRSRAPVATIYRVIAALQTGKNGNTTAELVGISPQRVSQIRAQCLNHGVQGVEPSQKRKTG